MNGVLPSRHVRSAPRVDKRGRTRHRVRARHRLCAVRIGVRRLGVQVSDQRTGNKEVGRREGLDRGPCALTAGVSVRRRTTPTDHGAAAPRRGARPSSPRSRCSRPRCSRASCRSAAQARSAAARFPAPTMEDSPGTILPAVRREARRHRAATAEAAPAAVRPGAVHATRAAAAPMGRGR